MVLTTMCYLKSEGGVLLLDRVKKKKDINAGKWIGVGGKLEKGESPRACAIRETFEETGLYMNICHLLGFVTFPGLYYGEDEIMFVYWSNDFSGTLHDTDEGVLKWIPDDQVFDMPTWPADHHYLEWMYAAWHDHDTRVREARVVYENDELVSYEEF